MPGPVPPSKRSGDTPPPRPDPIPGLGRPEVSKGVWKDVFKDFLEHRRNKSKDSGRAS
jgi:hypothetical protein